jgi:hypothetical protein
LNKRTSIENRGIGTMNTRKLGKSRIEVSALGMGCWAIGGPFWEGETPLGWGAVDDQKSMRAWLSYTKISKGPG